MDQLNDKEYDWKEHQSTWREVGALAAIAAIISVVWVLVKSLPL